MFDQVDDALEVPRLDLHLHKNGKLRRRNYFVSLTIFDNELTTTTCQDSRVLSSKMSRLRKDIESLALNKKKVKGSDVALWKVSKADRPQTMIQKI